MVHQLKIVKDIDLTLFWHHLNINLGVDELSISDRMGEKPINGVDSSSYNYLCNM